MRIEPALDKPDITIIPDFIPHNEWLKVYEYAKATVPKFKIFSNTGSPYRWGSFTHSRYQDISYERNVKLDDDIKRLLEQNYETHMRAFRDFHYFLKTGKEPPVVQDNVIKVDFKV